MTAILLAAILATPTLDGVVTEDDSTGHNVTLIVDPRIELMSIVQLLGDYFLITRYESTYKRDAISYFSSFASHDVVSLFSEMSQARFHADAVPKAMLALSSPPEIQPRREHLREVVERAGTADSLALFIDALRDFARESEFMSFLQDHAETFDAIVESSRRHVREATEILTEYSGLQPTDATVILYVVQNPLSRPMVVA